MELRRHGRWAIYVLLIWGNVLSSVLAGFKDSNAIVQSLDCTNDLNEWISCDMTAPNCPQYKLLFIEEEKGMHCEQCAEDKCCCYMDPQNKILPIYGENHTVTVRKGDENLGSKQISIIAGIKPRVPKIDSVRNSNGIFEIMWKSNMENEPIDSSLSASVTYFKKGATDKTSILVTPTSRGSLKVYQIPSRDLEPSTTYVVCVRSYIEWSGRYSDCSNDVVFTTSMSPGSVISVVLISLSVAAILISGAAFVCFVKIKTLWWDTVPKPKLLLLNLREQKILKPALPVLSLVQVEPLRADDSKPWLMESVITAGDPVTSISPGSTHYSQSLCSSPSNLRARADGGTFGSFNFDNKSYSIVLPCFPQQQEEELPEVRAQGELICDPAYRAANEDGDDQQLLEHLLLHSASLPLMDTDMCYQVTKGDSVQVAHVGDCRRSSISSRSSTLCDSSSGLGLKFDDAAKTENPGETVVLWDMNPVYGGATAGSSSPLPIDFNYQSFQSLVEPTS